MLKQKIYPCISILCDDKYISLVSEHKEIQVIYYLSEKNYIDVTHLCKIVSLDKNIKCSNNILYPVEEGTAQIQAIYTSGKKTYFTTSEFVVYDTFFVNNYQRHFIPELDSINIQSNDVLKAFLDTIFEFLDISYAYVNDISNINNPQQTKSKYLRNLFESHGIIIEDYVNSNSIFVDIINKTYRMLLDRLLDILEIRGTKTAYELFFGALGYDIELYEFWFDDNEHLIEINTSNPDLSTFDAYYLDGTRVEERNQKYIDPRIDVNAETPYKNNKSKYIRITYSKNDNIPEEYSISQSKLREYLEYLKPNYLEYLPEILNVSSLNDIYRQLNITYNISKLTIIGGGGDDGGQINNMSYYGNGKVTASGNIIINKLSFIGGSNPVICKNTADIVLVCFEYFYDGVGNVTAKGECYTNSYIGFGKLNGLGSATSYLAPSPWNPRSQGPQRGSVINWMDYLTQENRDNLTDGWVSKAPADFFALDFRHLVKSKTYNELFRCSKIISLSDIIQELFRFDSGLRFDVDNLFFDSFYFFDDEMSFNHFGANDIKNYYTIISSQNPKNVNEDDLLYDSRIKDLIVAFYLTKGIVLNKNIIDHMK